jgi:hypothetical protein
MPKIFRLEVAFNSNVAPAFPDRPVTMAYAFTDFENSGNAADTYTPDEQNLKLVNKTVPKGSILNFDIFDTATFPAGATPPEVTEVKIDCTKADTTVGDSPFIAVPDTSDQNDWWLNKTSITAKPDACVVWFHGEANSVGCNVRGRRWIVGDFIAAKEGAYEFTVTVKLSNGRSFKVDPEVVVDGAN